MVAVDAEPSVSSTSGSVVSDREKQGRRWLVVSFLFCPCHLPVIMAVLGVAFGGSALGALVARNAVGVGLIFGAIYVTLLAVGFRHLRVATRDVDCSTGECALPTRTNGT